MWVQQLRLSGCCMCSTCNCVQFVWPEQSSSSLLRAPMQYCCLKNVFCSQVATILWRFVLKMQWFDSTNRKGMFCMGPISCHVVLCRVILSWLLDCRLILVLQFRPIRESFWQSFWDGGGCRLVHSSLTGFKIRLAVIWASYVLLNMQPKSDVLGAILLPNLHVLLSWAQSIQGILSKDATIWLQASTLLHNEPGKGRCAGSEEKQIAFTSVCCGLWGVLI